MKRIVTVFGVLFVALALCLAGGEALAGKKGKKARKVAKLMTFKGEVVKQATKKGKIIGIRLKGEDGKTYRVYMNAKGKQMARKLAGKQAEISAALIRKGTKKKPILWLNVKSYKPIEEPRPEPPAEEEGSDAGEDIEDIP